MKIKKLIAIALLFACLSSLFTPTAIASGMVEPMNSSEEKKLTEDAPLMLWYDEESPYGQENTVFGDGGKPNDKNDGWERWSLPLGNGYFGANVFGRTASERIQLTEKTLCNDYGSSTYNPGGLNNFSETYIDFGHAFESVSDYTRSLDIKTATSSVSYVYDGVTYEREYFTSYEDYCMVIKLTSDADGKLSFTLRPTIPYLQDFAYDNNDTSRSKLTDVTKHGKVTSKVDDTGAVINLFGNMGQYNVDFEAQYRVFTDGNVKAGTWTNVYSTNVIAGISDSFDSGVRDEAAQTLTVTNGTLEVSGASEAYIVITLGTNYDQSKGEGNSSIYTNPTNANKLNTSGVDAKAANDTRMNAALSVSFDKAESLADGYKALRDRHVSDYTELFGRVSFTLDFDKEDLKRTIDELLARYQNDEGDGRYLEMLYYQYGRYLLIASSRETTLPANLQGTWNRYNFSPWGVGYWHNINEQMNYWHAFSTDLSECFGAYVNFIDAYMAQARYNAKIELSRSPFNYNGSDTGFTIGIGITPYKVGSSSSCGELGFTTQMFWDYYSFTQDDEVLREVVYPILYEAAQFITKTVAYNESEDAYLSIYSYSPEQFNNSTSWYYTEGTPYAQSFAYLNNLHLLAAAEILGVEDDALLTEVKRQIDKYDAILVGYSGQVKEFREEEYYGEIGEYTHRHISHLVGLFPGEMINANTPAWLDAAKVTLTERGDKATGWGVAHRLNLWSHTKEGERTYQLLNQVLKSNTATNLWDLHHPFQIDGNFGATSGITEMLLQSHEGYIDPISAIPENWADGSYTGLVARGNFSVDAFWRDGSLTELAVTSREGGQLKIHVQNIASAVIKDSKGNKISASFDGKDFASFDTEAGETYTVTNIPKKVSVAPVGELAVTQTAKNDFALVWQKSEDAKSYNVYKAVENDADYTFVGTTDTTSYLYTTLSNEENVRMTYRVCAVNADGRESGGTLAYVNPASIDVTDAEAGTLPNGSLQVVVSTAEAARMYILFEYDTDLGKWVEVLNSKYPVLIYEGYSKDKKYAVSASEGYFASGIYELSDIGEVGSGNGMEENADYNIFSDISASDVTLEGIGFYGGFPVSNVFDGNLDTRFAPVDKQNTPYTITVNLPTVYNIKTVRIYDFRSWGETGTRSDNTVIKVYADGVWTSVYDGVSLFRVEGKTYCEFDLGFAKAEKIAFTFENTQAASSTSLFEITATASKLTSANRTALLHAIEEAEKLDTAKFDAAYMTRYSSLLSKAKELLGSITSSQEIMNKQAERLLDIVSHAPTEGDLDLNVSETVYDGSTKMPWPVANTVPTVNGLGGKLPSDLVYSFSDARSYSFNVTRDAKYYAQDYTLEFSLLLEKNASMIIYTKTMTSYTDGVLGPDGWSGPRFAFDGKKMTLESCVVVAINDVPLESASATICDMENDKWYKIAIVIPITEGELTEYIDVCVNGTKYTIKVSSPFYGLSYPQFEKRNSGNEAIYLDNMSQRMGDDAIYYPVRDALNVLNSEKENITVDKNVITVSGALTVSELKAALGNDLRVYADSTFGTEISDGDKVLDGMCVVAYYKGVRSYERTYNYYTVTVEAVECEHVVGEVGCTDDRICTLCGAFISAAPGHDMVLDKGKAPTCTETGLTDGSHCTRCDEKVAQEEIPALGHNTVADKGKAPTCTETGLTDGSHCTRCDEKVAQEEIPALGHDTVTDKGKAPTCTETGLTDGSHCTRCDEKVAQEEIPALGHDYSEATCTEASKCERCDKVDGEALGHKYDNDCDTDCNVCAEAREVGEHLDSDRNGACDFCGATVEVCKHICHSENVIVEILWKIIRFFLELFGTQDVCGCGAKHFG